MNWEFVASAESPAAAQAVWDVLLDGRRWSFWNPGVEWMWIEGEPAVGTLATVKLRRMRQTACIIRELSEPHRFVLRLTVGPVANLDVGWTLTPLVDGGTRIEARVRIGGIAARPFLLRSAQRLAQALPASLERLANRAAGAFDE